MTLTDSDRVSRSYVMGPHRVRLLVGDWGIVHGSVICEAPADSFCRMSCPHDCEAWGYDKDHPCGPEDAPHTLVPLPPERECHVVTFIEAQGILDSHHGEDEPVQPNGLMDLDWDDGYIWRYAEEPS